MRWIYSFWQRHWHWIEVVYGVLRDRRVPLLSFPFFPFVLSIYHLFISIGHSGRGGIHFCVSSDSLSIKSLNYLNAINTIIILTHFSALPAQWPDRWMLVLFQRIMQIGIQNYAEHHDGWLKFASDFWIHWNFDRFHFIALGWHFVRKFSWMVAFLSYLFDTGCSNWMTLDVVVKLSRRLLWISIGFFSFFFSIIRLHNRRVLAVTRSKRLGKLIEWMKTAH